MTKKLEADVFVEDEEIKVKFNKVKISEHRTPEYIKINFQSRISFVFSVPPLLGTGSQRFEIQNKDQQRLSFTVACSYKQINWPRRAKFYNIYIHSLIFPISNFLFFV